MALRDEWNQFVSSSEFESLAPDQREQRRVAFFDEKIASKVRPEDRGAMRAMWDRESLSRPARTQESLIPHDDGKPEGVFGALKSGVKQTASHIGSAVDVYQGDKAELIEDAREAQKIGKTREQEAFGSAIQAGIDDGDDSLWDGIKNVASAAWEQPVGVLHEMVAQLPNAGVVLGGAATGAKLGALGGAAVTGPAAPIGATVGGIAGALIGMFTGNLAIEAGALGQERAADGTVTDQELADTQTQAPIKAGVITGVDALAFGGSRFIMGGAGRAVEKSVLDGLAKRGIDVTDAAAVSRAASDIRLVKELAPDAEAAFRSAKGYRRAGAAMALESVGEGTGEYLGSTAAGLDASFTEAAMESLLSLPMSMTEVAAANKLTSPQRSTIMAARTLGSSLGEEEAGVLQSTDVPAKERIKAARIVADRMKQGSPVMARVFMGHSMRRISHGRALMDEGEHSFYDALKPVERHKVDQELLALPSPETMDHVPAGENRGADAETPLTLQETTASVRAAKAKLDAVRQSGGDVQAASNELRTWLKALESVMAGNAEEARRALHAEQLDTAMRYQQEEQRREVQREAPFVSYNTRREGEAAEGELLPRAEQPESSNRLDDDTAAQLPPGTEQINMGRDRPERNFTPVSDEYAGVGRNVVERQAQGAPGLPTGTAAGAIKADQYRQLQQTPANEYHRQIEAAAHTAATSPLNGLPEPTEAQKAAGNYKKGKFKWKGLDISIENPQGSTRSGTDDNGSTWQNTMAAHYGDVKRTEGNDGDPVDIFMGPNPDSDQVFVIDQRRNKGNVGVFDEHKVMAGFDNQEQAEQAYLASYDKDWQLGPITVASVDEFKAWLKDGDTSKPFSERAITTPGNTPETSPHTKSDAVTLEAPMRVYHGTAAGNDFDRFDDSRANSGVGANTRDQGNQRYATTSQRAARWFSGRAEQNRQLMEDGIPDPDVQGNVLAFDLAAGSRVLRVEEMPRGPESRAKEIIEQARAQGYDAIQFPDRGFATIEGDLEVFSMLNEDGTPDTIIILNEDALTRKRTPVEVNEPRVRDTQADLSRTGETQSPFTQLKTGLKIESNLYDLEDRLKAEGIKFIKRKGGVVVAKKFADQARRAVPVEVEQVNGVQLETYEDGRLVADDGLGNVEQGTDRETLLQAHRERMNRQADEQAKAAANAKQRYHRQPDPAKDDLLTAITLAGGINRMHAEGVDPADFGRRVGIKYVFPKSGGLSMDEMAETLEQYGYVNGAQRTFELQDKLDSALRGETVLTPEGQMARLERMDYDDLTAEALESLDDFNARLASDYQDVPQGSAQAELMAQASQKARDAGIDLADVEEIIFFARTDADAIAELQEKINEAQARRESDSGTRGVAGQTRPEENPAAAGTGYGSTAPEADGAGFLSSYTEAELTAKEEREAQAKREEDAQSKAAEAKADADAEVSNFNLSGSNSAADVAAAGGQDSLFGASGQVTDTPTEPTKEPEQLAQKIDDFGEKLGGARKDELRDVRERLDDMDDEAIASSTLGKLWPKGEISRIEDPVSAAIYQAARDEIPNKPRVAYKLKRWVESVKQARELLKTVDQLGAGDKFIQRLRESGPGLNQFADKVELLASLDRGQWSRIGRVSKQSGRYSVGNGEMVQGSWYVVEIDGRREHFYGADAIADVIPGMKEKLGAKQEEQRVKFEIRQNRSSGLIFINKKGDNEYRPLKEFDDPNVARDYLRNNHDDLVNAWESVKNRDNVTKADMRRKANSERVGTNYRSGKDVTPEQFLETFGFRGVEFGNWVKQGKGGKDRQGMLNDAFDALMDLATVLEVPPKAISLDGKLGIGFGSRGSGSASAHFEPDMAVINLTKTRGAGSLAHEWFHALDNYFALKRGGVDFKGDQKGYREQSFITYRPEPMLVYKKGNTRYRLTRAEVERRRAKDPTGMYAAENWEADKQHPLGVRPQVEQAFAELVETLNASPMKTRAETIDKGKADGYWSRIIERGARSFETYVIASLANKGQSNDYLANVRSLEDFGRSGDRYPYLTPDEQQPVNDAFDKLFSVIETKETESGVALYSRTDDAGPSIAFEDVQRLARDIVSGWKNAPNVTVVANELALPADLRQYIEEDNASGQIDGVFHKGVVYLISNNIKSEADLHRILFHEALGHYGLRQLYGGALALHLDHLWNRIGGLDGVRRLEKRYGFKLGPYWDNAASWDPGERRRMMVDELVAHIAGTGQVEPSLLQKIAHLIRQGLRKLLGNTFLGNAVNRISDVELLKVVAAARQAVTKGESTVSYATHDPMFVRMFYRTMYGFPEEEGDTRYSRTDTADKVMAEKLGLGRKQSASIVDQLRELKGRDWKQVMESVNKRAYEGAFDGLVGLKHAEDAAGKGIAAKDYAGSGYVGARLATGVADTMHAVLHYGAPMWRGGVIEYKPGTRGLLETFSDLGSDLNNWLGWMAGNRAVQLMAQGRENNLTQEDIDALLKLADGKREKFERAKEEYGAANRAMLDLAEEAGLIDSGSRAEWESEWYVPFYRHSDADGSLSLLAPRTKRGMSHQTAGIKALRGGDAATNDLLENILTNWLKITDASMKNMALLKSMDNLRESDFISDETIRWQQVVVSKSEIAKRIKQDRQTMAAVAEFLGLDAGAPLNEVANELAKVDDEGFEKLWGPVAPKDPDIIRVQRNGRNEYYRVHDDALLRAVTHLNNSGFNDPVTRAGRWFKRLLTTGVTASPDFILRNFVRDAAHAWAISPKEDKFTFGKDSLKGLRDAIKQDPAYRELMFAGASFQGGYVHGTDPEASAQMIRRALEKKGLSGRQIDAHMASLLDTPQKLQTALKQGWQKYRELGDKVENANRLATFKAARASGKSLAQAVFEAKDLMDYSLRGNFQALNWLTDVVPFLNARLQGLSKLARAGKADPAAVGLAVGKIALFSVFLAALNDDDERYQELQDWEKDAYWHIFLGEQHWRIPKPFEIGIVAGTIPERIYHAWLTGSQPPVKVRQALVHGMADTLNFNPLPQAIIPAVEAWGNRSFYFDTPIESMSDEGKRPEDRYNAYTSELAVKLGQMFGVSPKKLQHLWEGYTGTMGAYALATADMLVRAADIGDVPRPEWSVSDLPVVKSFYRGTAPARNTQYITDLYDRLEEVNQIYRSLRDYEKYDPEKARELLDENRLKLKHRGALTGANKVLADLRKAKQKVLRDLNMTPKAKKRLIDGYNARINRVSAQVARMTEGAF